MARLIIPESNLVILGAWNPAIITPAWLRQQFPELLPGHEFKAEFVTAPLVSVRFTINDIQIDPSSGRLVFACAINDEVKFRSLPVLAESISERLPHTPVSAVGFNFTFETQPEGPLVIDRFLDQAGQNRFYAELGLTTRVGRQITHSFALPKSTLNLAYDYKAETTKLSFNFHYNTINAAQVREALATFAAAFAEAKRISGAIDPA